MILAPVAVAFAAVLLAAPVQPGGRVGQMTVVRALPEEADAEIWIYCNPIVRNPGVHRRTCRVPRFHRLAIGYGLWERSQVKLNGEWDRTTWWLWLDGRRIFLPAFESYDRVLTNFAPAGGATVTLRVWRVQLRGVVSGTHTLRYRSRTRAGVVTDTTWTFTVD